MNGCMRRCVVGVAAWIGLAVIALLESTCGMGCATTGALRTVADQNAANTGAYAANVGALCGATRELARAQTGAMVRRSREGVSADLMRVRAMITPSEPTEVELADVGAPWATALEREVGELRLRVNAAPLERRAEVGASLAEDHAATIDTAIGTPGFTIARVLRDALELDRVNALIEGEPNAGVRAGLMARRDAVLDGYLAVRNAAGARARYLAAVDRFVVTVEEQGRVLGLHAEAIGSYANGSGVHGTALGAFQNADLRAGVLELVAREWGAKAADDVRERLGRVDAAIGGVAGVGSH